jgi:hypothetical protein
MLATESAANKARLFFSLSPHTFLKTCPAQIAKYLWDKKLSGRKVSDLNQTSCTSDTLFFSVCPTIFKMTEHLLAKTTKFLRYAVTSQLVNRPKSLARTVREIQENRDWN